MRRIASAALLGLVAALIGLVASHRGRGGGRAFGPAPVGALLPLPATQTQPALEQAGRSVLPESPANPEEGFEELFAKAVAAVPPGRLAAGACAAGGFSSPVEDPAWEEAAGLLVRAASRPQAPQRSLAILADSLSVLERHLASSGARADAARLAKELPRLQLALARIQASTYLIRLELEARADREVRPKPRVSPLTEHVGRVLELLPLSATAAGLVHFLLAETGSEPGERRHYLRGCHRAYLEALLEPCSSAPWVALAAARLLERLLANMLALGEITSAQLARQGGPIPDLGVPWESPEAEVALARAWEGAGRNPASQAYQERRTLTAAFLSRTSAVAAAIHAAERFYRSYPRIFPMTPDAWPNLAWKPGAVEAIVAWIRASWSDPERERGVLDALTGLDLGGGLVDRSERAAVDAFFLELWSQQGASVVLRGYALVLLASARSVPIERVESLLEEALVEWGAAGSQERRVLAEAALAFLARSPREGKPFLLARLQALVEEPALDPSLRSSLQGALANRPAR